jgi:hypothetical protein
MRSASTETTTTTTPRATSDYAGQHEGSFNGLSYTGRQRVEDACQDIQTVLAQLGFSSVEEMIAAANNI